MMNELGTNSCMESFLRDMTESNGKPAIFSVPIGRELALY